MKYSNFFKQLFRQADKTSTRPQATVVTVTTDARGCFHLEVIGAPKGMSETELALIKNAGKALLARKKNQAGIPEYLWDDDLGREIVTLSNKLLRNYPNRRFFGIGTSPSYVIYGIEHQAHASRMTVETGYVPFSSEFLEPTYPYRRSSNGNRNLKALTYDVALKSPTYVAFRKNREAYRRHLGGLGLHPQKIVDEFLRSGRKTAVLDNIQTGSTFASFIYLMYEWAKEAGIKKEDFAHAFECVALTDIYLPSIISVPKRGLSVEIERVKISEMLRVVLNGNVSLDQDRFVPHYPPEKWNQPPPLIPNDVLERAEHIKSMLRDLVAPPGPSGALMRLVSSCRLALAAKR